jgi:hypothetical protein
MKWYLEEIDDVRIKERYERTKEGDDGVHPF